ncbi:26S proteasome non-ATPase regulatory subunit 10-like isoform X2 [Leptopilina heterotoma]|nr:26S proteasome non-ATPase regulatory subunit 10-like isoform X2 [Leptopilina heterotoma]
MRQLRCAINEGNVETVKELLQKEININDQDRNGDTALHMATRRGDEAIVALLLEFRAEINCQNNIGVTPLHVSAKRGHEEICKMLLIKGADVNARNIIRQTALDFAAEFEHEQIIELLLKFGAEINLIYRISSKSRKVIDCYLIKRKTANLFVSQKNLLYLSSRDMDNDFQKECEKEILYLKHEKISNIKISFFDVLINHCLLVKYMKNENIVQTLKSLDYETRFPIYGNMINCNFLKGMRRRELLEQCYQFFPLFYNNFTESPQCYHEKTLSFLNDKDLSILIKACLPINK